jgi:hypothetical protein
MPGNTMERRGVQESRNVAKQVSAQTAVNLARCCGDAGSGDWSIVERERNVETASLAGFALNVNSAAM